MCAMDSELGQVADTCEYENQPSSYIKFREFLDQISTLVASEEGSLPCSLQQTFPCFHAVSFYQQALFNNPCFTSVAVCK